MADMPGKLVPLFDASFSAAGELLDSLMQTLAKGVLAEFDAVHRNNRKVSRDTLALR
jgi:hypothetical protein